MKKVLISSILSFSMIFPNTAVLVSATTDNPYNTNGIILDCDPPGVVTHIDKKLEDILSSYEDETYSFKDNEDITFVITKEGDLDIFRENSPYTLVTMKNGKKPPVEEINKKIGSEDKYNVVFYNKPYSDGYKCFISGKEYKDTVYNILKDDENVESIEECYDITLERGAICFFLLDSDVDINELISEFPKLGLEELGEYPEYMKEIYPDYSHVIGIRNIENPDYYKELYSVFTNLKDKEINYYPILEILESDDNSIYASSKNVIYQAEKSSSDNLLGDINADEKVDISDLTELSLAIIGDKTLTESQLKVADVDKNGKTDLPDLARMRQYLSKAITALR